MRFKVVISFLLAFAVMLALAACAADTPAAPEAPAAQQQAPAAQEAEADADDEQAPELLDITITHMSSVGWVSDAERSLALLFEEETGIHVEFQVIPADQYFPLLMTRLNAGAAADLFGSQGGRFDIVTQLDIERNAVELTNEEWASRMDPLARAELSVNGRLFGQIIFDISSVWAIAYNKNIFADLNLQIPTTFDEFMALGHTLLDNGITPVFQPGADGWHHVLWFPEVGGAFERAEPGLADRLNTNQTTFAESVAMRTALEQIVQMVEAGFWGDYWLADVFDEAPRRIASGEYAMVIQRPGFGEQVHEADPSFSPDDIGFFVIPLLDNQMLNMNPAGPSTFIWSGSEQIDAAKAYLSFLARLENLQYILDNDPSFNMLPWEGVNDTFTDVIREFYNRYDERATVWQTQIQYLNPLWMDIGREIVDILVGGSSPEQMLQNIDSGRAAQATAAGDPNW